MLIDDDMVDNLINRRAIEKKGIAEAVITMDDGNEALQYLKEHQSEPGSLPDLIFLDINMPIMNGFEFLEGFESLSPSIKEHAKIIMLSSSLDTRDMEKARSNPYVIKYATKPLTFDVLDEIRAMA
jgi:CheY-like chemotaxis protein